MSPESVLTENQQKVNRAVEPGLTTYSVKDKLLPAPTVRLVFHGLLWFIFHGTDECQVAVHNSTRDTISPHTHPHDFSINLWTIPDCVKKNCGKPRKIYYENPKTLRVSRLT
jgi:hypothetical protein